MRISDAIAKMIESPHNSVHDIEHLLKVHSLARCIGQLEGLDEQTLYTLELAAVVHDISCPYLREKYHSAPGELQEKESCGYLREFFNGTDVAEEIVQRVCLLVSRHHTYHDIEGLDLQILLEADFLVVAAEKHLPPTTVENPGQKLFKTTAGRRFLNNLYLRRSLNPQE